MTEIEAVLHSYQNRDREYLLPILQDIQRIKGFITTEVVVAVAAHLKIPTSKVYAVASFYDQFRFVPFAKYQIKVCNGTGCHIEGSNALFEELKKQLEPKNGNQFKSDLFSLEQVQCLGACGNAPVMKINEIFYTSVTPEMAAGLLSSIKAQEEIQ